MAADTVRVLRIIEYIGPRDQVEIQVRGSIHGERKFRDTTIRGTTLGIYPDIMDTTVDAAALPQPCKDCRTTVGVTFAPEPFAEEVHGDTTLVWMCDDCRTLSAREV